MAGFQAWEVALAGARSRLSQIAPMINAIEREPGSI
jgi:hypothetical protein